MNSRSMPHSPHPYPTHALSTCAAPGSRAPADVSRGRRRGFTLVELLVSIAVLSVALSVVGVVFSVTSRTTAEAQGLVELQNWMQQFVDELKADLRSADPTLGPLVIVGDTVPAALTPELLDAQIFYREPVGDTAVALSDPTSFSGAQQPVFNAVDPDDVLDATTAPPGYSDPRADVLMFFSRRANASTAPPLSPSAGGTEPLTERLRTGDPFVPSQVIYGHASIVRVPETLDLTNPANRVGIIDELLDDANTTHIRELVNDLSPLPASQWQLVRRNVILQDRESDPDLSLPGDLSDIIARSTLGDRPSNSSDAADEAVRRRLKLNLATQAEAGDLAFIDFPRLREIGREASRESPYDFFEVETGADAMEQVIRGLLYESTIAGSDTRRVHFASYIPEAPLALQSNLSLQALPACVWFQVEFLMPEDARNSRRFVMPLNAAEEAGLDPQEIEALLTRQYDPPRWRSVEPLNNGAPGYAVFLEDSRSAREYHGFDIAVSQFGGGAPVERRRQFFTRLDQIVDEGVSANPGVTANVLGSPSARRVLRNYPYALRITVKAIDPRDRFSEPLTRTIIHRFN